jgi:quinate/shikimate dehydrogenase (NAD+)
LSGIRLGLIGDNIAASRAPELHCIAGRLCGLTLTYDLLVPRHLGLGFDSLFDRVRDEGYRGLNITYPYKEHVVRRLQIDDASIRSIAACNTVVFEDSRSAGLNTDYTGFIAAFRNRFGPVLPGNVAMAGCGGVGKAIAFALARLGAKALRLYDIDRQKSETLARALAAIHPTLVVEIGTSVEEACDSADGLVNCTPLGMAGYGGSAFPPATFYGRSWVFDAVYTPIDTPFLNSARSANLSIMNGYELFFYQGLDAFRIFSGREIDPVALRDALAESSTRSSPTVATVSIR